MSIGLYLSDNDKGHWMYGSLFDDTIKGNGGSDHLFSGAGADTVSGGTGNDVIYNDRGSDVFSGGSGNDTISFRHIDASGGQAPYSGLPVVFDLSISKQFVFGFGIDEYHGFENIEGGNGSDILYGNNNANKINGGGGGDYLIGRGGNDKIEGSVGADVIDGGKGADKLGGYFANMNGFDFQKDTFRYNSVNDSGPDITTRDEIFGSFNGGNATSDQIDLHLIDANPYLLGDQAFDFIGTKAFAATGDGQVRIKHVSGDKYLVQVDTDIDKGAEMSILVHSQHGLHAGDFIL